MRKVQDIILKLISVMGICFFTALTIGAIGTGRKLAPFSETVSTVSDNWIKAVGIVDRKSTRLNSSHRSLSRMPSSA